MTYSFPILTLLKFKVVAVPTIFYFSNSSIFIGLHVYANFYVPLLANKPHRAYKDSFSTYKDVSRTYKIILVMFKINRQGLL